MNRKGAAAPDVGCGLPGSDAARQADFYPNGKTSQVDEGDDVLVPDPTMNREDLCRRRRAVISGQNIHIFIVRLPVNQRRKGTTYCQNALNEGRRAHVFVLKQERDTLTERQRGEERPGRSDS